MERSRAGRTAPQTSLSRRRRVVGRAIGHRALDQLPGFLGTHRSFVITPGFLRNESVSPPTDRRGSMKVTSTPSAWHGSSDVGGVERKLPLLRRCLA
ncbi:MAG: hypothetical protein ACR2MW_02955 [Chthoniobacterales bacterium]